MSQSASHFAGLTIQSALALLLAVSGLNHLRQPAMLASAIRLHGLLSRQPTVWASLILTVELTVAVLLAMTLVAGGGESVLLAVSVLLVVFAGYAALALARGVRAECGCGFTRGNLGWSGVVRLMLLACAAAMAAIPAATVFTTPSWYLAIQAGGAFGFLAASVANGPLPRREEQLLVA